MTQHVPTWFALNRHDGADDDQGNGGNPPDDKTLTQADVDRIVADRLARERAKYADHDDLKAKAAKLAEIEAAQQTEAEKLTADRDAALKRADAATARAVRAEVKALADGFADRDDAALYLGDLSQYVTDGEIDTQALGKALAEVLDRKPHLKTAAAVRTPAPDPSQGRGGTSEPVDFRTVNAEQFAAELAKYGLRPRS